MRTIAFDLDGTLFLTTGAVDYDDPNSVSTKTSPHTPVCALARTLGQASPIAIVTGRTREGGLEDVTERQLESVGLYPDELHLQDDWTGYADMRTWKATVLEELEASVYVGDHDVDELAAKDAGCEFVHARTFRRLAGVHRTGVDLRSSVTRSLGGMNRDHD
jgi:phosphoglycolate phosphatase-like HAD superfamily hydrolase